MIRFAVKARPDPSSLRIPVRSALLLSLLRHTCSLRSNGWAVTYTFSARTHWLPPTFLRSLFLGCNKPAPAYLFLFACFPFFLPRTTGPLLLLPLPALPQTQLLPHTHFFVRAHPLAAPPWARSAARQPHCLITPSVVFPSCGTRGFTCTRCCIFLLAASASPPLIACSVIDPAVFILCSFKYLGGEQQSTSDGNFPF